MIKCRKWQLKQPRPGWHYALRTMIAAGVVFTFAAAFAGAQDLRKKSGPAESLEEEMGGSPPAVGGKADSRPLAARPAPASEATTVADQFPFRFVGLGGAGSKPEFIALTDGFTSFVVHAGDVIGDRYRIDELRAKEFVLTDIMSGKGRTTISYENIQYRAPEPSAQGAPATSSTPTTEALSPVDSSLLPGPVEAARAPDRDASGVEIRQEADILRTMIAPPPVNRAEQAMPMEMMPPPKHNPMIITTPTEEIPMITTPSRREHREAIDIPLGPGK